MSFDFRKGDFGFAEPNTSSEYETSLNLAYAKHSRKPQPQYQRGEVKRMVVIKPRVAAKGWTRDAESASISAPFKQLSEKIDLKYGHQSSLQRLVFSEEYLAVIGFGPRVVPLLLSDLKTGNTPWFWALKAITREDVGADVGGGDFRGLREAWLAWGIAKGLL